MWVVWLAVLCVAAGLAGVIAALISVQAMRRARRCAEAAREHAAEARRLHELTLKHVEVMEARIEVVRRGEDPGDLSPG